VAAGDALGRATEAEAGCPTTGARGAARATSSGLFDLIASEIARRKCRSCTASRPCASLRGAVREGWDEKGSTVPVRLRASLA
jgi:hypothetical protein